MDDVADNREIYAEMLAAMGYRVVEARNGAEGVATAIAENAACAGCAAYLVKPCLPEDLAGVVEMTLRALREAV